MEKAKDIGIVYHRGSGKSTNEYLVGLEKMYLSKIISHEDYTVMKAAALNILCGISEEEAIAWMEQELSTEEKGDKG